MAQDLEKMVVSLEANIKQYERELARAQKVTVAQLRKIEGDVAKSMGRVEKSFATAGNALAGFGKGLAIGAIAAGVAGLTALVATSVETAAAVGDLSDQLGISSDKLQELNYGAVQANMDFGEFSKNLLKFSKSLGEARNGAGDLRKTLLANGFSEAEIRALDYSKALDVVADLVKNAANEQDAMLIVTQAFGRGGAPMLEFLSNGKRGLDEFAEAARKANALISEESVKSAQKFDDAWAAAKVGAKGAIAEWSIYALGKIFEVNDALEDTAKKWGQEAGFISKFGGTKMGSSTQAGVVASPKSDRQATTIVPNVIDEAARKKAAEDRIRAYEAEQKAINGVIEALKFEIQQGKASELQQQINTELRKAGTTATDEQKQQIIALTTAKFNQAQAEEALIGFSEKQLELDQELFESKMALAEAAYDAFDAIAIGGEKASDVIKDLASNLLKAAVQASLFGTGPFASLFGTGGSGGIFGSLFGKPAGRASGGPVSAGRPYIVGERAPELFVPSQSGSIIPKLGGAASKVSVNVMNFGNDNIDVQHRNGPNGPSLDVIIGQKINSHLGSGRANSVMKGQFGIGPQKARR